MPSFQTISSQCSPDMSARYWNWSLDWEDPTKSPTWDPLTGFGGDGDPNGPGTVGNGSCVIDGPFADYDLLFYDSVPRLHCLSRGFGRYHQKQFPGSAFNPSAIQYVLDQETFFNFTRELEGGPHDAIPNNICGDFFAFESPNDPVFFLHHTDLDYLWWEWQRIRPERIWEYGDKKYHDSKNTASLDDIVHMKGLVQDMKVRELMYTEAGMLCYAY